NTLKNTARQVISIHGLNNRYSVSLVAQVVKFTGDGSGEQNTAYFNAKTFIPKTDDEVTTSLNASENEILNRIETYQNTGSGWTILEFVSSSITYSKYCPISYGCS